MMVKFETKKCIVCRKTSVVELDKHKFVRWIRGEHAQNVWPEKSADERELLITGTHPECWDTMFPDEEEE